MKPQCAGARAGISALLDGALSRAEARVIEEHLHACVECRAERTAVERTHLLLASAGKMRAPGPWVRQAMRAAATLEAGASAGAEGETPGPRTRGFPGRPWALSSLAAAAVVAVVFLSLRLAGVGPSTTTPEPAAQRARPPLHARSSPQEKVATLPPAGAADAGPGPKLAEGSKPAAQEAPRPAPERGIALGSDRAARLTAPSGAGSSIPGATAFDSVGMTAPAPSPPVERIPLARIRFPEPAGPEREDAALKKDRLEAAPAASAPARTVTDLRAAPAPPEPTAVVTSGAAGTPAPRLIRVRVLLDAASRVLSAASVEEPAAPDAAALIARLPGATIDLTRPQPSGTGTRSESVALSRAAAKTLALAPSRPPREIILEIELEPSPGP